MPSLLSLALALLFLAPDEGVQMFDIDLAGQVTGSRIIPIENAHYDPAVSWNGRHFVAVAISGNGMVALQECDANSGGRAVAYVEQELGYEAQRRRTVRR